MIDCEMVRELALKLPEAEEHEHWGRPSFRVRSKIFLTLWPEERRAVIQLARDAQLEMVQESPDIFSPVPGGWGERGSTNVMLDCIERNEMARVLQTAWARVAPKRLVAASQEHI